MGELTWEGRFRVKLEGGQGWIFPDSNNGEKIVVRTEGYLLGIGQEPPTSFSVVLARVAVTAGDGAGSVRSTDVPISPTLVADCPMS